MIVRIPPYEIRPYTSQGARCLQVFKWQDSSELVSRGMYRGKAKQAKYVSMNYYPATLKEALDFIIESMVREGSDAHELEAARAEWRRIRDDIHRSVKLLTEAHDDAT